MATRHRNSLTSRTRRLLLGLVAVQLCTGAASAREVCRFAGTTDYDGRVAVTSDVSKANGLTRVRVVMTFEGTAMLWFPITYLPGRRNQYLARRRARDGCSEQPLHFRGSHRPAAMGRIPEWHGRSFGAATPASSSGPTSSSECESQKSLFRSYGTQMSTRHKNPSHVLYDMCAAHAGAAASAIRIFPTVSGRCKLRAKIWALCQASASGVTINITRSVRRSASTGSGMPVRSGDSAA